jgi:hypothetical protein
MDKLLLDIMDGGLTWPLAMLLFKMVLMLFILLSIKGKVSEIVGRLAAKRKLKRHKYLSIGNWVNLPTTATPVPGKIVVISAEYVTCRTDTSFEDIPVLDFVSGRLGCRISRPFTQPSVKTEAAA